MADFRFHILQQIVFGVILGESGDLFQHFQLAALDGGDLLLGCSQSGVLAVELLLTLLIVLHLSVQRLLFLLQAVFLLLEIRAPLFDLLLIFGARFMDFLLGLQHHFAHFCSLHF